MEVIIDSNVAVIANRQNNDVQLECQDACIDFIIEAKTKCVVLIDNNDEIRSEYAGILKEGRPYELGTLFLIHLYQNQWNPKKVRLVELDKTPLGDFVDFPTTADLSTFDMSDRKFAALAKKTGVPVTNATDSDWATSVVHLANNGITVNFLCGCNPTKWFK